MEIIRSHPKTTPIAVSPSTLSLYRTAPSLEVRLDEFELFAVHRLRVLKGIADALSHGRKPEEMEKLVSELWKTNMKHQYPAEAARKDVISHFVLRLNYFRTEDLRKWFLSLEITLFRHRLRLERPHSQRVLMTEFNLPYKALGDAEYEAVKDKLVQVARSTVQFSNWSKDVCGGRKPQRFDALKVIQLHVRHLAFNSEASRRMWRR